ncbi:hypothetical protein [Kordiimonas aquimaris]|uniref:hypothetical protein n=1 Tax=Kordiimonas aquimaris TaxID=707591 RepID=UPI0021CF15C4|nr:hypothetical protein [Kordiimonas aquimaris]
MRVWATSLHTGLLFQQFDSPNAKTSRFIPQEGFYNKELARFLETQLTKHMIEMKKASIPKTPGFEMKERWIPWLLATLMGGLFVDALPFLDIAPR